MENLTLKNEILTENPKKLREYYLLDHKSNLNPELCQI